MNRSPLFSLCTELGARFVSFAGWEMPVQYGSVLDEHRSVRTRAGWFDVTHLGRFELTGRGARDAVRNLLCNDIDRVEPGRCQYTMMLNPDGGIIDDLILWWWDEERFWLLPNATNHKRVMGAFAEEDACTVEDLRTTTVMIALQGPAAPDIFAEALGDVPHPYQTATVEWGGSTVSMAGTGYTGEAGGEICTDPKTAEALARAIIEAGAQPCGLGARDTLRLETGLPLWGEDIDETTTPLEAGLDFAVSFEHEFVGHNRLQEQNETGVDRMLTGFVLEGRGIPRHGYPLRTDGGGEGTVTSGNLSPMIEAGVGMGYISPPPGPAETRLEVQIRGKWVAGRIASPPFHKG